ncbi:hypothetical protein RJ641_016635 [Dillenia turbinata]|uniref:Uncharacterized protein n=1 Tax=Dillenia turbinata TaxID=194707 RepID=A0AAN8Z2D9_9MAGN
MLKKFCWLEFMILCTVVVAAVVSAKNHGKEERLDRRLDAMKWHLELAREKLMWACYKGNPANDIVDLINKNRTAQKLSQLSNSPGLGCMALQFAEECKGNCSVNNTIHCQPPEDDFTEVFAPNCGVELPTFSNITAHIVGCQSKYLQPSQAFSHVLIHDKRTLAILRSKDHKEVGIGLIRTKKGPFIWCVLFSSGQTKSTFVLEDHGIGIKQKKGCHSGTNITCSKGHKDGDLILKTTLVFALSFVVSLF